jgi:hypothetical protein
MALLSINPNRNLVSKYDAIDLDDGSEYDGVFDVLGDAILHVQVEAGINQSS